MDLQLKRYKKEFDHSYSFGVFPTLELLHSQPESVVWVLAGSRGARNEGVRKIEEACREKNIPYEVNDKLIERLAPKENVYAVGVFRKYEGTLDPGGEHVVLVNPGDMGNLGTIMRTMLGFGVRNLGIVRPAADVFDPRVVRASMGAIFRLAFQYFDTFDQYRQRFQRQVYSFMTDGKGVLVEVSFARPFTLVFGNESAGLPEEYLALGTSVSIRHSAEIDSLNLPTAVGIALYEATKNDFS